LENPAAAIVSAAGPWITGNWNDVSTNTFDMDQLCEIALKMKAVSA
jgi:hypothetical protein